MSEQTTTAESIEAVAAELGLTMSAEFVPWSKSRNAGEKHPSLNWKVTLHKWTPANHRNPRPAILTTDYMAGSGHCPSYQQGPRSVVQDELVRKECETGKRARWSDAMGGAVSAGPVIEDGLGRVKPATDPRLILPKFADVLHSLCSDADVIDHDGFESWASDLGYDTDSRAAEATYRTCLDIALKLRNALGEAGFAKLREACHGY